MPDNFESPIHISCTGNDAKGIFACTSDDVYSLKMNSSDNISGLTISKNEAFAQFTFEGLTFDIPAGNLPFSMPLPLLKSALSNLNRRQVQLPDGNGPYQVEFQLEELVCRAELEEFSHKQLFPQKIYCDSLQFQAEFLDT